MSGVTFEEFLRWKNNPEVVDGMSLSERYARARQAAKPVNFGVPGGLGVVEGSLTIALVAYGGQKEATVAAVVLYRLISFWGLLGVGWAAWAVLAYQTRRHERAEERADEREGVVA